VSFDPFGLAERFLPETVLHRLVRIGMSLLLGAFLVHRLTQYRLFAVKTLWLAETLLFTVLIVAYLFRTAPVHRSRGAREIVIPLAGSALPFCLLLAPPNPAVTTSLPLFYGLLWGMAIATLLTVWGMWSLRRSFSITVEARQLVTHGPYRLVRHPIYTGEILAAAAVAAIRFSPVNLLLLLFFIGIQLWRTRLEEAKLSAAFPAYREFARRSLWFWG
jgi:protein-S-isoprenylcysteine O-methyltransferase Ste14